MNSPIAGLQARRTGGVLHLTLCRPEKRNPLSGDTVAALYGALKSAAADDGCRLVILHGSGGSFASGADIAELRDLLEEPVRLRAYYRLLLATQELLRALPMPTVAAIDGYCIGAGLSLALCCDLRVSTPQSLFAAPPARLGLLYSNAEIARLMNQVGPAHARDLMFTGRMVRAREAAAMGLVERLTRVAEHETAVGLLAAQIEAASAYSIVHLKRRMLGLEGADSAAAAAHDALAEDAFFRTEAAERLRAAHPGRPPRSPAP